MHFHRHNALRVGISGIFDCLIVAIWHNSFFCLVFNTAFIGNIKATRNSFYNGHKFFVAFHDNRWTTDR